MKLTPEARLLLRIAARLVPAERRDEWAREWEGELWYWLTSTPEASLGARLELARHCWGAIVDAFYLRVDRDEMTLAIHRVVGHPAFPITAALLMLVAVGAASGGFARTRRALAGPPFPHAGRLAILFQDGPLIGERHGVPAQRITAWDRQAVSLEGAAAYFWYRTVSGPPAQEVAAAKVGPAFFELLEIKPAAGRLFRRSDAVDCRNCVLLSYEFWSRHFGGDAGVVGRDIIADNLPARVIGVLPRDFWFLDVRPAIWTLYVSGETWRVWDVPPAGAICRLRDRVTPSAAQAELRATSSGMMPRSSGRWVTVNPITDLLRPSPLFYVPLAALFLAVAAMLSAVRAAARPAAFTILITALALAAVLLAVLEFTDSGQPFAVWAFLVSSAGIVYCCQRDLRLRCPVCLHRLTMPVRIGHAGQVLLEQAGTELVCPRGHGMLYTPEIAVEAESWVRV